ncbi:MAG: sigma 54-interacting transcriptional regulator [Terriglobales bacterium]
MYTNLPAAEVDATIEYGLMRIGQFLGADRCSLVQFSRDLSSVRILNSWSNEGIEPLPQFTAAVTELYPWWWRRLMRGQIVQYSRLEDLPEEAEMDKKSLMRVGTRSLVSVPIAVGGSIVGTLTIGAVRTNRSWPEELVQRLRLVGEIFANAVVRKQKELEIHNAFEEIKNLKDQLEADCTSLRQEIELEYNFHNIIGQSNPLKDVFLRIQQIAPTDTTVLVLGETGSGKELVARAIHNASRRKDRLMVKVNCAALPSTLVESELFGHEKGAFTSAQAQRVGRFELAHGNTLFLDEVGELPLESQAKLLRVLQDGEFERLGSSRTSKVDVRIIAATNRNLEDEVKKGRFRQDLWYRLNVFPITVPPLRQRKEDIPLLVIGFLDKFSRRLGKTIKRVPPNVMNTLQNYHWPGNVRELENVIERAVINTRGSSLQLLDNLDTSRAMEKAGTARMTLEEAERNYIVQVLEETNWRVSGPKGAASILGINHSTLRSRMRKLGIRRS